MTVPIDPEELVGVAEIAEMANVSRSAVANWRARNSDFPDPVAELQSGPVFLRSQIRTWLVRRKVPMATVHDLLSRRADGTQMSRSNSNLAQYEEIEDIKSIVRLSTKLEQRLTTELPSREEYRSINGIPNDIYFRQGTGEDVFWWSGREWPNGSFHHLFGLAKPGVREGVFTVVEFNCLIVPPFDRRLGGAFLRDSSDGQIWLAHRGKVTINVARRRVSQAQFFAAMAQVGADFSDDAKFALITKIDSENLIDEIEAFARMVRQAKENLVRDLGQP
jgi:hypothetical protein